MCWHAPGGHGRGLKEVTGKGEAPRILSGVGVTAGMLVQRRLVVKEIEGKDCGQDDDVVVIGSHSVEG